MLRIKEQETRVTLQEHDDDDDYDDEKLSQSSVSSKFPLFIEYRNPEA